MDFIELSAQEARALAEQLHIAASGVGIHKLRVAFDEGAVKFKINESMWSPPMGHKGEAY